MLQERGLGPGELPETWCLTRPDVIRSVHSAYLEAGAGKLTGYCAAMVGPADAEDAAQEAYFRLWKNLYKLPNEAAANAYLYKTA